MPLLDDEPKIVINGAQLTPAQALVVRVAIESFADDLHGGAPLGGDEHGLSMADAYRARIAEIRRMMYGR